MIERDILKKIKKLLALSQSNNEHEAALAAARAQELMDQYKLTSADVDATVLEVENPVGDGWAATEDPGKGGFRTQWKAALINGIAVLNSCVAVKYSGARIKLIGRESDRQIVEYLAAYLCRELDRLSDVAWNRHGRPSHRKTWDTNFGYGAVNIILQRMKAEKQTFAKAHPSMTALVLRDDKAVEQYTKRTIGKLQNRKAKINTLDREAYSAGTAAGKSVSWSAGVRGAAANKALRWAA